jgi:hypothetical protein
MNMSEDEYAYGVCGVFCEMCPTGNGRISELAKDLLHLTQGNYDWAKDMVDFDFGDVRKGLEWFAKGKCPTCLKIEEPWCDVLKCEKITNKELRSCLQCDEFMDCPSTDYHRDRYPFVIEHHRRVKEVGLEQHLKEERKRTLDGVCLIDIRKY